MKKIFKSKKGLKSLGAILVALTLIVGATFAWFTYTGGGAEATITAGTIHLKTNFTNQDALDAAIADSFQGVDSEGNPLMQPGDFAFITPSTHEEDDGYGGTWDAPDPFFIENDGTLDAMVRLSVADFKVTLDVTLEKVGDQYNYAGPASFYDDLDSAAQANYVKVAGTFEDGKLMVDGVEYLNGVILGLEIIENAANPVINTQADVLTYFDVKAIEHRYDWVRGDHYLMIPAGKKVEMNFTIDLLTNAYNNVLINKADGSAFDAAAFALDRDMSIYEIASVDDVNVARNANILLDNKYQNSSVSVAFAVDAAQALYTDSWMDTFGLMDPTLWGEFAHYGALDEFDNLWGTASIGTWKTVTGDNAPVLGVSYLPALEYLLPLAGDYLVELEAQGITGYTNPNSCAFWPQAFAVPAP